jgi:hypothetical protein
MSPFSNGDSGRRASEPVNQPEPYDLRRVLVWFGLDRAGPGTIVVLAVVLAVAVWALVAHQTQQDRERDAAREYAESVYG